MRWMLMVLAAVPAVAAPAHAADTEATGGTGISYKHQGQFGVYTQVGAGYRALFPYHDEFCGQAMKSVCTGFTPFWIELGVSYGISNSVEVLADVRFGLGSDFKPETVSAPAPHVLAFAPGFKFYVNDVGSIKWFSSIQLSLDFTDYSTSQVSASTDVGIRNVNGILVDLHRTFGVYAHFGETVGFVRWLRFEMDAGIGMQVRFP